MAWMTNNYTSNAVLLDHSSLLSYVYSASSNSIVVSFKSNDAFTIAQQKWDTTSGLLFVLHDDSCDEGGSCHLKVITLQFDQDSLTATASCSSVGFETAVSFFDFEWGVHRPGKKNPDSIGFSSTTSAAGGSTTGGPLNTYSSTRTSGTGFTAGSSRTTSAAGSSSTGGSLKASSSTRTSGTGYTTGFSSSAGSSTSALPGSSSSSASGSSSSPPYPTATVIGGSNSTSNGTSSNSTSGDFSAGGSNNDNCTAPTDEKYGLPTACFGQYFDEDLDDSYGYQDSDNTDFSGFIAQFGDLFYPDPLAEDADDASEDASDNQELGLQRRWSWIPNILVKAIAKVLPITGVTTPYTKEISLMTLSMNVPQQRTTVQSPWGQQVLIKSFSKTSTTNADNSAKLDIYCVDCGMQGTADITGKVGISVLEGISSLGANMKADMAMTLKVGIDAQLQYSQTFNQPLFNVPLSPLCVANVICVGPYLKLGADLTLKANANGQLLAGASITMHNAQASIDVAAFTASASGWQPEFNPTFQANGSIDLSADVGLPLAVVLGINVLNGKYAKEAAIVDRPSIVATAAVAASAGIGADGKITGGATETDGCTGIKTTLGLKNQVYVTIPGHDNIMLSNPPALKLKDGCIALPAAKVPDSSTGDASTPTGTDSGSTATATDGTPASTATDGTTPDTATDGTTPDTAGAPSTAPPSDDSGSPNTPTAPSGPEPTPERRSLHPLYPRQNTTTSSDIVDTTTQSLSNGTTNSTAYIQPDSGDKAYNLTDGYLIATLIDTEARYQILPCANGNLHLFGINDTVPDYQCGDMWTMTDTDFVVMADGMARIPVYYPDEMSKTGVSRIRLADVENIPVGAEDIVFVPAPTETDDGDSDTLYYPCDQSQTTFYSIVCTYADGSPSKMFLAGDVETGLAMLKGADVQYSITGGQVSDCYYLPLMQGLGYDSGEDDGYDTSVDDE